MTRLLKTTSFLILLSLAWIAQAAVAPHDILREASDQLFAVFKSEQKRLKDDPARIYALVDHTLGPYVDFPLASQLVLGKHWRTASPEQRERFTTEFHHMLVRFYTGAFVEDPRKVDDVLANANTIIQFAPAELKPDGVRASVVGEVHLPSGQVVPVSFALHHKGAQWKVYDVSVEGISLVTNYRTSFSTEIQQAGLDAFIERLAARNREFLAKTP
jgi:phospholipid transport system substrate-binding protein